MITDHEREVDCYVSISSKSESLDFQTGDSYVFFILSTIDLWFLQQDLFL